MPRGGGEWEEDEWFEEGGYRGGYGYVRPPPPPVAVPFLAPVGGGFGAQGTRVRSRSFGQQPAPNVYVYTSQHNDMDHADTPPPAPPVSGRGRASRRDDVVERVEDRLEDIERDLRRATRSRSRAPEWREPSPMYRPDMQMVMVEREREERRVLEQKLADLERAREIERERDYDRIRAAQRKLEKLEEDRLRDGEDRNRFEREEELMKKKAELRRLKDKIEREEEEAKLKAKDAEWKKQLELERLKDEEKRKAAALKQKEEREKFFLEKEKEEREAKAERDRILAEREKEERAAKAERKRIALELEAKEKEEEEERKAIVAAYQLKLDAKKKAEAEAAAKAIADFEKKKQDEKAKEEAMRAKFKAEDEAKAKKAKEEAEMWKLKLKMEEDKEKAKKKAEEERLEEEMSKKLSQFGFQNNQIQAMIHPKKAENLPAGALPNRPAVGLLTQSAAPTFIKVHRDHIDIKTLEYFQLPWEYDSHDRHYIIILQEMDERETDVLFEHTRKLRIKTTMAIEDRGRDRHGNAEYAFVRRRKPSASPSRKRDKSARRFSSILL